MKKNEYLSVAEIANLLGVSRQAIYKRLSTDLSTYVVKVDNQNWLKKDVLRHLGVNDSTKKVDIQPKVDNQTKLIEYLENEVKEKRQEIDEWKKRYEEEHKQLLELTIKVGNTLESVTQTQLADKIIEGKKLIDADEQTKLQKSTEKNSIFKRLFCRKEK